jgi:hypothetical protein
MMLESDGYGVRGPHEQTGYQRSPVCVYVCLRVCARVCVSVSVCACVRVY